MGPEISSWPILENTVRYLMFQYHAKQPTYIISFNPALTSLHKTEAQRCHLPKATQLLRGKSWSLIPGNRQAPGGTDMGVAENGLWR